MSMEKENRTPPTALVLCTDERLFRFFEIELAHLGIVAMRAVDPTQSPCMAVVDSDEYSTDTFFSEECPILTFGHAAVELPLERGIHLRRPFALTALEAALRQLTAGASFSATPLAVTSVTAPSVDITPSEPTLELSGQTVTINGRGLTLTPAESVLLRRLYQNRGEVVAREALASLLGGGGNSVEVYICHLRTKIEKPLGRRLIRTVRGQGYVLE